MKASCLLLLEESSWIYVLFQWSYLLSFGTLTSPFLMFTDLLWTLCFGKVPKPTPLDCRHCSYCRGKWHNLRPAWLIIRTKFCMYVSYAMLLKPQKNCRRWAKKGLLFLQGFLRAEQPRKPGFLLLCVLKLNSTQQFSRVYPCYFSKLYNFLVPMTSMGAEHLNGLRKLTWKLVLFSEVTSESYFLWNILPPHFVYLVSLEFMTQRWNFSLTETASKTSSSFNRVGIQSEGLYLTGTEMD